MMTQKRIYSYFDRNPQLHVLFLFDKGFLEGDLQDVVWPEDYHYEVFDGCWFNVKYAIESLWADKKVVLLFRQPYAPQTEEEYLRFPLLDMLVANLEYKDAGYEAFLQQYGLPLEMGGFVERNMTELQSSKIMSLIQGALEAGDFNPDFAVRAFLTNYLWGKTTLEWKGIITRMILLDLPGEEKKCEDFYHRVAKNSDAQRALDAKLTSIFGVSYSHASHPIMKEIVEILKYNVITQLLAVEKGDPYKGYRVQNSGQLEQMQRIYEYGMKELPAGKFSTAIKALGANVKEDTLIQVYGIDAVYYTLTEALAWPIINTLCRETLWSDPAAAVDKARELKLKFGADIDIQHALSFVECVATFYQEFRQIDSLKLNTPEEYIAHYTGEWYRIDTYYRQAIKWYRESYVSQVSTPDIITAKSRVDIDYAKFANTLNLEWTECVNHTTQVFNGIKIQKQFDFYDNYHEPNHKQVVIISDALRYDVAVELIAELGKKKHVATLHPMLGSLPSETKYCKSVMWPHDSLSLVGTELLVDGTSLNSKAARTAQLKRYVPEAECITYEDKRDNGAEYGREFFKRPLIYILHDVIDRDGHDSDLPKACEMAVKELAALVNTLHATENVTNVIITADHGFLFNDISMEDKDKHSVTEDAIEKKTRYYLTTSTARVEGVSKYQLCKSSGLKDRDTLYVAVPNGTNRFAAPGGYKYCHGGASLQELIVPVIVSKVKRVSTKEKVNVRLLTPTLNMVSSLLRFQLIQVEPVSMTTTERTVKCAVYNGEERVTEEKTIKLDSSDAANLNNRVFDVSLSLTTPVTGGLLLLKVWDVDDTLNPLIKEPVKNSTFIEQDF